MFIDNKYTRIYNQIVTQAQSRVVVEGYTERHHIEPKSLGGKDGPSNLVQLTAREHFICHWLLTKMVNNKKQQWSMINALGFMMWNENEHQERYRVTGRIYALLKEKHSKMQSEKNSGKGNPMYGRKWTQEMKDAKSIQMTGKKLTLEQREKVRQSKLGKKRSEETKAAISAGRLRNGSGIGEKNSMYGKKHSKEAKAKQSAKAKLRVHSPETRAKISESAQGRTHTGETKQKMRDAWVKRKADKEKPGR